MSSNTNLTETNRGMFDNGTWLPAHKPIPSRQQATTLGKHTRRNAGT